MKVHLHRGRTALAERLSEATPVHAGSPSSTAPDATPTGDADNTTPITSTDAGTSTDTTTRPAPDRGGEDR